MDRFPGLRRVLSKGNTNDNEASTSGNPNLIADDNTSHVNSNDNSNADTGTDTSLIPTFNIVPPSTINSGRRHSELSSSNPSDSSSLGLPSENRTARRHTDLASSSLPSPSSSPSRHGLPTVAHLTFSSPIRPASVRVRKRPSKMEMMPDGGVDMTEEVGEGEGATPGDRTRPLRNSPSGAMLTPPKIGGGTEGIVGGRMRSRSAPGEGRDGAQLGGSRRGSVVEAVVRGTEVMDEPSRPVAYDEKDKDVTELPRRRRGFTNPVNWMRGDNKGGSNDSGRGMLTEGEYERMVHDDEVVDYLDVVDPEIATLTTFSNIQNSLFLPPSFFVNRTPTVDIPMASSTRKALKKLSKDIKEEETAEGQLGRERSGSRASVWSNRPTVRLETLEEREAADELQKKNSNIRRKGKKEEEEMKEAEEGRVGEREERERDSDMENFGEEEEDWCFQHDLDEHVNHLLTSKREKFKRSLRGFWTFYTTPLGFISTNYFVLITFWGSAIFLFIIGWVPASSSDNRRYWIEICDQILCALFTVVGIGLAPFRARDTYTMYHIVKYYRKSEKIRKARNLPKLTDKNELPSKHLDPKEELPYYNKTDEIVLSPEDQEKLVYYQTKFHESHSFYRAHETATHYAFPIHLMIAIVILLDFHSIFQTTLGGVTWGIDYLRRPVWPPIFLISCSLSCSISAGILIGIGGSKTKKTEEVERRLRLALEKEARLQMKRRKEKEDERKREREEAVKDLEIAARETDDTLIQKDAEMANGNHHFWSKP